MESDCSKKDAPSQSQTCCCRSQTQRNPPSKKNKERSKCGKCLLIVILLVGFAGGFVPVLAKKLFAETKTEELRQVAIKVNFTEIAEKNITLPITWGHASAGIQDSGLGVKFFAIKRAFPHGNTIRVTLTGKAFVLINESVKESDVDMRISVNVAPVSGKLSVQGFEIDELNAFDFTDDQNNKLLANKHNIMVVLEKSISSSLMELPIGSFKIYEMTREQIVLWAK
jgi:hypothetical protein